MLLFNRAFELNVSGREVSALHCSFRVEASLSPKGNTAELVISNLSADTRKFLQSQTDGVVVELRAGYVEQTPLPRILLGQLRVVTSQRDGASWVTTISTGDSDVAKNQPVSFSLGPGASFEKAVKNIVGQMKAGAGNLAAVLQGRPQKQYPSGIVVHGIGDEELDKILNAEGLEHSWQSGELQVTELGGGVNATAVKLSPTSGLIGSPEVGLKTTGRIVKARCLLNADIYPGRVVAIESENTSAFVVCRKVVHQGDTGGKAWWTDIEASPRV
jgi:hypothetical protein